MPTLNRIVYAAVEYYYNHSSTPSQYYGKRPYRQYKRVERLCDTCWDDYFFQYALRMLEEAMYGETEICDKLKRKHEALSPEELDEEDAVTFADVPELFAEG